MRRETAELLERLDRSNISPNARVSSLRPASQQIVSIARALSRKIRLLIMDEPSAILDDHEIETLFGVVRRLTAEGVGVIYISHRLDEVRRIGDRVTVLSDGRTVAVGLARHADGQARGAHGRPQGRAAVPRAPEAQRRRAARGARRRARARDQARRPSRCTRARSSASAAWSVRVGPSCWADLRPRPARRR